ncbi:HEPN domain-containing protein [Brevundimonas vesicularis]|uniref:HEPN domain-containing protein n=1 Tax=Brevundimonas vesicularis TaxID=41276 RepID=A0ABU4KQU7_BREVE|nr:HEPN domain-containing protein [Brevundimonas vesicularis]MDX2335329.1 HEPN domain-containing protein [Brevundimonas vesicularis]
MKTSIDHLPPRKQVELRRVVEVIRESFAETVSTRRAERLKNGKILKIILYGSYARGDWVHDPVGRYFSDFDLLIVVDHEDLTDGEFWHDAENKLMPGETLIRTPVSLIVHSLEDVNEQLDRGRYFWADIVREGIVLFDTPGAKLRKPADLKAQVALKEAEEFFGDWTQSSASFARGAKFYMGEGADPKLAAFNLHQSAEHLYHCVLLVVTLYSGKAHNLAFLRKKCEAIDARLAEAWPRETKFERRCFELLREAYVKARYSKHYKISVEELTWLTQRVEVLRALATTVCEERLAHGPPHPPRFARFDPPVRRRRGRSRRALAASPEAHGRRRSGGSSGAGGSTGGGAVGQADSASWRSRPASPGARGGGDGPVANPVERGAHPSPPA